MLLVTLLAKSFPFGSAEIQMRYTIHYHLLTADLLSMIDGHLRRPDFGHNLKFFFLCDRFGGKNSKQ